MNTESPEPSRVEALKTMIVGRILFAQIIVAAFMITMTACAGSALYEINLMPAPDVYDGGAIDPFTDTDPISEIPYSGILYATDREPAEKWQKEHFYLNKRGHALRLGVGQIELGREGMTWKEARRISLLKNRTDKFPLKIAAVEEFGILDRSLTVFFEPELRPQDPRAAAEQFASFIDKKLATSQHKDIFIYIHGYRVIFENPLLVATELWHFLGYDGVFIAYAWPSTPSRWAYIADLETAAYTARNLRLLIEYLADETQAERIHIIGYSAGTHVVINALAQIALETKERDKPMIRRGLRIGHVILVGSDFDRDIFGGFLEDGLLEEPDTLTVYVSETDRALNISRWLFRRQRLGQMVEGRQLGPAATDYLRRNKDFILIDVTEAEEAASGNGHAYFRQSPWVSSDILMTLMYSLSPEERGLIHDSELLPIWVYPDDYIKRLRAKLYELNPALSSDSHALDSGGDD